MIAFARELWHALADHDTFELAAMVAFWSMLSLSPFIIFTLSIVGLMHAPRLGDEVMLLIRQTLPPDTASMLARTVGEVLQPRTGLLALFALVLGLWSASSSVSGIQKALDRAWGSRGRPFLSAKLTALATTLVCAALLLLMAFALMLGPRVVAIPLALRLGIKPAAGVAWTLLRWPIVGGSMLATLSVLYTWLPRVARERRRVLPGALVAMVLWLAASRGFAAYVSWFDSYSRTYGALGTVIVLLMWLYLSAIAVLVGGEVNALLARQPQRGVLPLDSAVTHVQAYRGEEEREDQRPEQQTHHAESSQPADQRKEQ